ncbi:Ankyrin repeat domain-containing protein 29 [Madurella mycetomatis]|uniref:Ankyrin repeat domain-containing protein 29 n=1 Tax=Madurella mycetomatis TaxID=100816 RepID=A0A175W2W2_9PEZI|nr:Ankyrin repeat domain-containing protein 29 [Madurella mycetomatis]
MVPVLLVLIELPYGPVPVQAPVTIDANNSYEQNASIGAVLVTEKPVIRSRMVEGTFLAKWAKENEKTFPKLRYLVASSRVVKLGCSAGVEEIVNAASTRKREDQHRDEGSPTYEAKDDDERLWARIDLGWATMILRDSVGPIVFHRGIESEEEIKVEPLIEYDHEDEGEVEREDDYEDSCKDENEHEANSLITASAKGCCETVDMLIRNGVDVNAFGSHPYTALIAASENGHNSAVQILLNAGADPNISTFHTNALYEASVRGHHLVVVSLLASGADLPQPGGYHRSALLAACYRGHDEYVRVLLAAGADVNPEEGSDDEPPLFYATYNGYLTIVRRLLAAGALSTLFLPPATGFRRGILPIMAPSASSAIVARRETV